MTTAVVVGSGPNGLAAAVTLARAGVSVRVVEAADVVGGGVRSAELTLPGLIHDECSGFHPFATGTPFARSIDLTEHGLRWLTPEMAYSHPLDGGRGAAAWVSLDRTVDDLGADGRRWRAVFAPVVDHLAEVVGDVMAPLAHVPLHPITLVRFGIRAGLPATMLARLFTDEPARALFAGLAAHAFRPLHTLASSAIALTLGSAAHRSGWPVAEGGSQAIAAAMTAALREHGGTIETGHEVRTLAELGGPDLVLLDVAPAAAVRIVGDRMPRRISRALRRFRRAPGAFKVEYAVEGGVPWLHEPSRHAGTVHLGGSLARIAYAERQVTRGAMPDRPFVLVGQQSIVDPSRASGDVHPVYAYAHVPHGFTGDATAAIDAQFERYAPGFTERVLARHVRSTTDLPRHNANYVGGDIIGGANTVPQMLLRPRPALDPYSLGVPGVYLCSASTPPGAGAHGMCGFNAASAALEHLRR